MTTSWLVVAALFLTGFMLYGGGLYAFILLAPPIAHEYGWNQANIGGLVSAFWLSAPLALWAEPLIRWLNVRRLTVAGIFVEAIALICVPHASRLWQMYLLRALAGLGKVMFAITVPITISRFFTRRFGLALAINYAGWQIGGLVLAPIVGSLIQSVGWRNTSVDLGLALVFVAAAPAYWATSQALVVRSAVARGEADDELHPEALKGRRLRGQRGHPGGDANIGILEVISIRPIPSICLAAALYYIIYSGVLAHQPCVMEFAGMSKPAASIALGATAGVAAIGCVGIGWLADRYSSRGLAIVLIGSTLLGTLSLFGLTIYDSSALLVLHIATFGVAVGGADVYWITCVRNVVDKRQFPVAWGLIYFVMLTSIVLGPILAGAFADHAGGYGITLACESFVVAIPLIMMISPPRRCAGPTA